MGLKINWGLINFGLLSNFIYTWRCRSYFNQHLTMGVIMEFVRTDRSEQVNHDS